MSETLLVEPVDGLWWPLSYEPTEIGRRPHRVNLAREAARRIAQRAPGLRTCLQAGGHVGLWPQLLAGYFATVYTCEPDAANFQALGRNVTATNVYPLRAVLGDAHRGAVVRRDRPLSGLHYVVPDAPGPIPMLRIDDFALRDLDALVLDIEGGEFPALLGAEETIARCRPLIVVEDLGWGERLGYGTFADIETFLAPFGYTDPMLFMRTDKCFAAPQEREERPA